MRHATTEQQVHLSPRAYTLIGLTLLALGLAISGVNGTFYIVGLGRIEPDPEVRELRAWYGILAIVAHAAFFSVGAFLRHDRFKTSRRLLAALACFLLLLEIATVYTTKVVFAKSAEVASVSVDSRVQQLQAQIEGNRRTAQALREAGEKSSRSWVADSRADGARSIREAAALEARNEVLIAELARAQVERRPTVTSVLGSDGMRLFSAASSIAFILAGVTAVSVGGLLIGVARSHAAARTAPATAPATAPVEQAVHRAAEPTAPLYSAAHRWAMAGVPAAAIPAAAFAAPVVTVTAPAYQAAQAPAPVAEAPTRVETAPAIEPVQTSSAPEVEPVHEEDAAGAVAEEPVTAPQIEPEAVQSADCTADEDDPRYARVFAAVQSGAITPSIRAIQAAEGGGTDIVRSYLKQMENEGLLVRAGRGYKLA